MAVEPLEATAGVVVVSCGYCPRKLDIPLEDYKRIEAARRDVDRSVLGVYGGFFVSRDVNLTGRDGFYCDEAHHTLFTES